MASAKNQQPFFPPVPPSLSADDHEMRDYHTPQDASRPAPNQAPYLTPYLGLRARLSQVWINQWTILLFLILVRLLIAAVNLDDNLDSARSKALSACTQVESMGSAMASMPHYMSQGVNEITAGGIERAVNGLMSMLMLSITAVEEIIVFVINMITQTYVCLITFAVGGSLHAALSLIEDVTDFLNKTIGDIGRDLKETADDFQSSLNKFVGGLNSIPSIFGSNAKIPTLDITGDLTKLNNLQIPSSFDEDLQKLNNSIPDFAEVRNFTDTILRLPFEKVKQLMNESMVAYKFDRSVFPIPQKEQLSFCSDNNGINEFFDGLIKIENLARKIFVVVLTLAAILCCAPMAWKEIQRWRLQQRNAQLIPKSQDPMDAVYIVSRPYTSKYGILFADRFGSNRRRTLIRWAVAYATTTPALFVLSLGVAGLFACLCQYILLEAVKKETPHLTAQVGAFADKVVVSLNNASEQWAIGTNQAIVSTNADINQEVFGWVNTSTHAVNETLNVFVNGTMKVLNDTFGGTILYDPIKEVLNCLVLLKIQGIQKGLTWVHDHAHIDFPLMPNDTFSLGAAAKIQDDSASNQDSFLANPDTKASDEITDAVTSMINKIESGIRTEALISTAIVLVWVIIALIGITRVAILWFKQDKTRAEGGHEYVLDPVTTQFRGHDAPYPDAAAPPYEPGNTFHGQPYTITPRPFPSSSSISEENEKLGYAGARSVSLDRPGHVRGSSYGEITRNLTTPGHVDEKNRF